MELRRRMLFAVSLLVGLTYADLINDTIITMEHFPEELVRLKFEFDIVDIVLPQNQLAFKGSDMVMFFILADDTDEKRINKGLFVRIGLTTKKLLDNGVDISIPAGFGSEAYFAAEDGIYSYNDNEIKAMKYGTINDNIIGIVKANFDDPIYILTKDQIIYKVTDDETKKEKVAVVNNAQQIAMDFQHNLYCATDKDVFKYTADKILKKIEGIPVTWKYVKILRPELNFNNGIKLFIDREVFKVYSNGTIARVNINYQVRPTAYGSTGLLYQVYGLNKKIYEYNYLTILFGFSNIRFELKTEIITHMTHLSSSK